MRKLPQDFVSAAVTRAGSGDFERKIEKTSESISARGVA